MRATSILPRGGFEPRDTITLDYDRRHRRRMRLTTDRGAELLLDLAETTHIRDGEGLDCGGDRAVLVIAAPEPLAEITAPPALLIRLAWHLGNRHLDVEFAGASLRIRRDHVIEAMAEGLGGEVSHLDAPFDPESGAYAHG